MYLPLNTCMQMQISELHFLSEGISGGSWWKKKDTVLHRLSWVRTLYHSPCPSCSHCWRPSNTEIVWQALCKLHWSLRGPASHLPPILIAGSYSGRVRWDRQWQPETMLLRQEKYKIPWANTHTHTHILNKTLLYLMWIIIIMSRLEMSRLVISFPLWGSKNCTFQESKQFNFSLSCEFKWIIWSLDREYQEFPLHC